SWNTLSRDCWAGSSFVPGASTPICRTRSACCARAASGRPTTAPPSRVMNSRRRMNCTPTRPTIYCSTLSHDESKLLHCRKIFRLMSVQGQNENPPLAVYVSLHPQRTCPPSTSNEATSVWNGASLNNFVGTFLLNLKRKAEGGAGKSASRRASCDE